MIPTRRLLYLLLVGALPVGAISLAPAMCWVVLLYMAVIFALVLYDRRITPKMSTDPQQAAPGELEVVRINESKLSLGAQNRITLGLHNTTDRTLQVELRDEFPLAFISDSTVLSTTIKPDEVQELIYHVKPLRRGDYRFGNINVRYVSALGTFKRQVAVTFNELVKVYPNVLDMRKYDLLARRGLLTELGLRNTRLMGVGTEFERLREYTPDDEYRRINWKATARRGKPIAVEYETERSQSIISVVDAGRLMRPPIGDLAKVDYAINAALLMSYVALLKGDHVGLLTFADYVGSYLPPRKGKGQFHAMLEVLYNVPSQPVESNHARALSYLSIKNKRRSLIIVYTDLTTLDAAKPLIAHMARLAQRHVPLCVVMSDPNLVSAATQAPETALQVYERAVAERMLDERRVVLETLNRSGVYTLDVPADKLTISVIDKYLELKGRGVL